MTGRGPILFVLLSSGCNLSQPVPDTSTERETVTFEMMTKEKTYENCVAGAEGCAYIRFDYPIVVDAPVGTAVDALSKAVHAFLVTPLREDAPTETVNDLMDQFISDFASFKKDFPTSAQVWFLERKALVAYETADLVSLSFTEQMYTGGAHDIATMHYVNLDPRTGATIALTDILEAGSEEKLKGIAEARFRAVRKIEDGVTLADAGFNFPNGEFALTENFAIGEEGLTFYYNANEIAPYATGPTELLIPYKSIDGLLRERDGGEPSRLDSRPQS